MKKTEILEKYESLPRINMYSGSIRQYNIVHNKVIEEMQLNSNIKNPLRML
ncbi:hypothetical protein LCGC14_1898610 [marine sediment metagenome]|uniref:Uncharacterized protein n=1 Tax=marine sediment metagenome TaxID=412755 RepID=A0A0F9IB48_9ZZZZ